jgi:hypothetical protein
VSTDRFLATVAGLVLAYGATWAAALALVLR